MHFTRRPGRGRNSRGRGNGSYSRDYHRQLNALSDMGGVQPQHGIDSQALMAHSANFGPYYVHNPYIYSSRFNFIFICFYYYLVYFIAFFFDVLLTVSIN